MTKYSNICDVLKRNGFSKCPVTPADVEAAEHIFGPDIGSLNGKTAQRNPPIIDSPVTTIPASILEQYRNVTLSINLMYVNWVAMLISLSRNIKFATIEAIPNNKTSILVKGMLAILQIYQRNGFNVEVALMDGEFGHLHGELGGMGVTLNEMLQDEHMSDIERFI